MNYCSMPKGRDILVFNMVNIVGTLIVESPEHQIVGILIVRFPKHQQRNVNLQKRRSGGNG